MPTDGREDGREYHGTRRYGDYPPGTAHICLGPRPGCLLKWRRFEKKPVGCASSWRMFHCLMGSADRDQPLSHSTHLAQTHEEYIHKLVAAYSILCTYSVHTFKMPYLSTSRPCCMFSACVLPAKHDNSASRCTMLTFTACLPRASHVIATNTDEKKNTIITAYIEFHSFVNAAVAEKTHGTWVMGGECHGWSWLKATNATLLALPHVLM